MLTERSNRGCDKINLKGRLPTVKELISFRQLQKAEE